VPAAIQQRCWNHEAREAVCRCPECGRSYCRECVTEHEARLLCAACIVKIQSPAGAPKRRSFTALLALTGIVVAFLFFYGAGEALILITNRMEQSSWPGK